MYYTRGTASPPPQEESQQTVPALDQVQVRAEPGMRERLQSLEPAQNVDGVGGEGKALRVAVVRPVLARAEGTSTQDRVSQRRTHLVAIADRGIPLWAWLERATRARSGA